MSTACGIRVEWNAAHADDEEQAYVLRYLPQVRVIAHKVHARLPQHVELADLIGAGVIGLIDAIRKFDPARNASLATYAQFRIRGAILDSLRSQDWGTRRLRRIARRIDHARDALTLSLGRVPLETELAAGLSMTVADFREHLTQLRSLQIVNFSGPEDNDVPAVSIDDIPAHGPSPLQSLLAREKSRQVALAVNALPPREERVIVGYYSEERSMKEIGEEMGVSESRVCQIHAAALRRLKNKLSRTAG